MGAPPHPGDDGYTGILGEGRLPKYDLRLESVGTLDELGSILGLVRTSGCSDATNEHLSHIQRDLYQLMGEVAAQPEIAPMFRAIGPGQVAWIDDVLAQLSQRIKPPAGFIQPGDTRAGAFLDLARTVTRRAERRLAELYHQGGIENAELLRYINRLSLLFFWLELSENAAGGKQESTLVKENPD